MDDSEKKRIFELRDAYVRGAMEVIFPVTGSATFNVPYKQMEHDIATHKAKKLFPIKRTVPREVEYSLEGVPSRVKYERETLWYKYGGGGWIDVGPFAVLSVFQRAVRGESDFLHAISELAKGPLTIEVDE